MAKVLTEARTMCPELIEAIKLFDRLAYSRQYSEVFSDFVDWLIWQHLAIPNDEDPLKKYKEEEKNHFKEIYQIIHLECKQRTSLWTRKPGEQDHLPYWYDPLGRIYQCVTSKNKSSLMGQFFTPESLVDFMTQIAVGGADTNFQRILDPACGSGSMGLSAATHLMNLGIPCWVTMNDLDSICTRMTAVNMCLNGIVGEVICMNGLDIKGSTFRFGYKVVPMLSMIPQNQWEFQRMIVLMKTGMDIKKQYVLIPLPYEASYLKQTNDTLLKEFEERAKITEKKERETKIKELQNKVKARMSGTLFDGDNSQIENVTLPEKKKSRTKKKTKRPPNSQQELFDK